MSPQAGQPNPITRWRRPHPGDLSTWTRVPVGCNAGTIVSNPGGQQTAFIHAFMIAAFTVVGASAPQQPAAPAGKEVCAGCRVGFFVGLNWIF